ncbi:heavy metal translocating P-type ATPase [Desulfolutivibrio sulfoxidireducens]|uniref:heavy metal translocating P-type ATPase n=1 Tax=Desulfolutivibrio sulfoxidireducens TaxID=2773299 RepID=UPI00159DB559|nr:cation-translocating P-type ATPase [Desulfolutivibrio sulfoxidireducens]QLA14866.1 heavy metal translocating P-type ATPase [Desulfolutivibrio sulfoxidireducens]QLA18436.1 heavy metal translocating P-type ATPase [Desulfolutivibrio sulfoxidireducens]
MNATLRIKHALPGRLRLALRPKSLLATAKNACANLPGVLDSRVNQACAALVVRYDPKRSSQTAIVEAVRAVMPGRAENRLPERKAPACVCPAEKPRSSVGRQLARFLSLTGAMSYVFVKEVVLKGTVAQTLLSPLGLVALAAAVPLLRESLRHARQKRFTMEGFLAAGCVAAAAAGQAVTALEILWIHAGAETLKAYVAERARRSISAILDLTAKNTFILAGEVEVEVPVSAVRPRDIVVLHTGEKISVDGLVISGQALVDESPITGRAEPELRTTGHKVFAGAYVRQGIIHVRAECVGDATYLARIMRLVEDSLENKAPIETTGDDLARRLLRIGMWTTLGTLVLTGSLWRAFTVLLVMACPCATVLSASTAISSALSAAARRGILIKGGRYLEEVGKAEVVCFDKTGTLTTNQPRIEEILNFSELSEDELLLWAYSAEMHNHHPLALAVKHEAVSRGIDPISHIECDFTLGKGVRAVFGTDVIRLGNRRYLDEAGIDTGGAAQRVTALGERGLTIIFLAKNDTVLAALGFANELRPDAAATVRELYRTGVSKVALVTGDTENTAVTLCRSLGIEECRHSVLPEQKADIVRELKNGTNRVIMVGDGINDALALADADIGIAMSAGGSDVAIEAADIALVKDDLADILYVRDLSRQTLRVARQNFWIATSTNLGGALAGALGVLSPVAAGLLHIVHTLGVLANSSRLLTYRPAIPLPAATSGEDA